MKPRERRDRGARARRPAGQLVDPRRCRATSTATATSSSSRAASSRSPRTSTCGRGAAGSATAASAISPPGRPVVTQDTGFGKFVPTGEGLFAFSTMDEAVDALARIDADYATHGAAARRIAAEHFGAEPGAAPPPRRRRARVPDRARRRHGAGRDLSRRRRGVGLPAVRAGLRRARLRRHLPRGHRAVGLRSGGARRSPPTPRRTPRYLERGARAARCPTLAHALGGARVPTAAFHGMDEDAVARCCATGGSLPQRLRLVLAPRRVPRRAAWPRTSTPTRATARRSSPPSTPARPTSRCAILRRLIRAARRLLHARRARRRARLRRPDRRARLASRRGSPIVLADWPVRRRRDGALHHRACRGRSTPTPPGRRRTASTAARTSSSSASSTCRGVRPSALEVAISRRGAARAARAPRAGASSTRAPSRRRLDDYRRYLAGSRGELSRREERLRRDAERLVQHAQRGLPGVRPAGRRAGHRVLRRTCRPGPGCTPSRTADEAVRGAGGRSEPTTAARLRARARRRRAVLSRASDVLRAAARRRAGLSRGPRSSSPATSSATRSAATRGRRCTTSLGLRALGHDVWFYEDTGHYALAYNPVTDEFGPGYDYGRPARRRSFLDRLGLGERWVFVDVAARRGARSRGGARGGAAARRRSARERRGRQPHPAGAPRRTAGRLRRHRSRRTRRSRPPHGDARPARDPRRARHPLHPRREHRHARGRRFRPAGYTWHPTRPPIAIGAVGGCRRPAGTRVHDRRQVGRSAGATSRFAGETFRWRKRTEWLRCLDLPARSGRDVRGRDGRRRASRRRAGCSRAHGWRDRRSARGLGRPVALPRLHPRARAASSRSRRT